MYNKYVGKLLIGTVMASALIMGCGGKKEQYLEKAEQYMEKGQYDLAQLNYSKAIMEDEDLQTAYRGAGIASMKLADYERAEDMLLRGLKASDGVLDETELDLSYYLGETQICLEKYEDAIETYSNVLEVYEEEAAAYFYRGAAYLKLGNEAKAKEDFNKAAKQKDAVILYGIYEAYEEAGSDQGVAYLEQITKLKGEGGAELYVIGKAYHKLGDEQKAIEYLEKSKKEKEYQAIFYLAGIYKDKGDYGTAVEYYKEYDKAAGLTMSEYYQVVESMAKAGDCLGALELNQQMREGAGESQLQELMFDAIVICEKGGDYASAREKAEEYVAQYPDDEEGQKEYQFLLTR